MREAVVEYAPLLVVIPLNPLIDTVTLSELKTDPEIVEPEPVLPPAPTSVIEGVDVNKVTEGVVRISISNVVDNSKKVEPATSPPKPLPKFL